MYYELLHNKKQVIMLFIYESTVWTSSCLMMLFYLKRTYHTIQSLYKDQEIKLIATQM